MISISLPQADGSCKKIMVSANPLPAINTPPRFNRIAYAAAHVVIDPLAAYEPWSEQPVVDWAATLQFRSHLYRLGFKVAEAMDTAQRGMGLSWPLSRELIRRSIAHARAEGGDIACGVGTDQLPAIATLAEVEAAYREQMAVVEAAGGRIIFMCSRALARCARGPDDYLHLYQRLLCDASQPVILHWLGDMFDPALRGYWGSTDTSAALETVHTLISSNADKVAGIKVSLLDARWEIELRRRLPSGVQMYTGDDFNFAELIAGDAQGFSHGLLGIFDPIAPVAASALVALAQGDTARYHQLLDPTVALSREIFCAPTRHYKTGVVFLAWLNGHQSHFSMAGGLQSARSVVHLARVFELAAACGVLADPPRACARMNAWLSVNCGISV